MNFPAHCWNVGAKEDEEKPEHVHEQQFSFHRVGMIHEYLSIRYILGMENKFKKEKTT